MTTPNIKPEDVKRLITKDENGLLPCPKCREKGTPYDCSRQCVGEYWSEVRCDVCHHTEDARKWNTRAHTPALSTLQTLLNQAGEAAHAYLSCDDADYTDINEFAREKIRTRAELVKALAAIEPYLTTGDTNE